MFYAKYNSYASETDIGFSNTWGVVGFAKKADRDLFVKTRPFRDVASIAAKDVNNWGGLYLVVNEDHTVSEMIDNGFGDVLPMPTHMNFEGGRIRAEGMTSI